MYAVDAAFQRFDANRGELNQRFQESPRMRVMAGSMPCVFPGFVRFPVIAVVEQVDAEQIMLISVPRIRRKRIGGFGFVTVAMAIRAAGGMRQFARNKRIGGKGNLRRQSWNRVQEENLAILSFLESIKLLRILKCQRYVNLTATI